VNEVYLGISGSKYMSGSLSVSLAYFVWAYEVCLAKCMIGRFSISGDDHPIRRSEFLSSIHLCRV
jgi:hypothetical protein